MSYFLSSWPFAAGWALFPTLAFTLIHILTIPELNADDCSFSILHQMVTFICFFSFVSFENFLGGGGAAQIWFLTDTRLCQSAVSTTLPGGDGGEQLHDRYKGCKSSFCPTAGKPVPPSPAWARQYMCQKSNICKCTSSAGSPLKLY